MDESINFVKTKRGKDKLCHAGYYYTKNRTWQNTTYWRCEDRKCPSRFVLRNNTEVMKYSEHNHTGTVERMNVLTAQEKIKYKAKSTSEAPAAIVAEIVGELPASSLPLLPTTSNLKRIIRKERNRQLPKLPTTLSEIDVQGRFTTTIGGEQWLIHDSGPDDPQRMLIFSSLSSLQQLSTCSHWYADGTFDTCPRLFYQLYTIHGEIYGEIQPLVFVFMPGKTEELYVQLLHALVEFMENREFQVEVTHVSIDFELSVRNAFVCVFGNDIQVNYYLFHFCRSMWRKIQQLGLSTLYNSNTEFSLYCRMLNALAFLPVDDVSQGLQRLQQIAPKEALPLIRYIEETYVLGKLRRNDRRSRPLFHPSEWNVYQLILQGGAHTINCVEAWHRRFGVIVRANSNIYCVLDALRRENRMVEARVSQLRTGAAVIRKNAKAVIISPRLSTVVADYQNRDIEDYLRRIAHNLGY